MSVFAPGTPMDEIQKVNAGFGMNPFASNQQTYNTGPQPVPPAPTVGFGVDPSMQRANTQGTPSFSTMLGYNTTAPGTAMGGAAPAPTTGQPTNSLQTTVANGYNNAMNATGLALAMNLGMSPALASTTFATAPAATATGYDATGYDAFTGMDASGNYLPGFAPVQAAGSGYTAAQMDAVRDVAARQLADTDLTPYMNPYTDAVIDQTAQDMERARLIQQNAANDAMMRAGAFGGSRHGVANAETNRAFYDRLGATTGSLRNLGFQNAQGAALQDIANTMRADLANQGMDFNVGSFNTGQTNEALRTGANNATSASIANANAQTQMAMNAMNAMNNAAMNNAAATNAASEFGANAMNNVSQFNSLLGSNLSQANALASNTTSQNNANAINTFGQNMFGNTMDAAAQMGDLSGMGFDMANQITANQAADGATAQGIDQALIDAAQAMFDQYMNAGNLGLNVLQNGVNAAPGGGGTTTQSSNPGLFGVLSPFL